MKQPLTPDSQDKIKHSFQLGLQHSCPKDELLNFSNLGTILQSSQISFSGHLWSSLVTFGHLPENIQRAHLWPAGVGRPVSWPCQCACGLEVAAAVSKPRQRRNLILSNREEEYDD